MDCSSENIIFKAKSKEAFVIKILGELLANTLSFSQFTINDKGIFLLQSDEHRNQLIDIGLYKENFVNYRCAKPEINFLINSTKFYKLLKSIKKKDSVTITIMESSEDEPMTLGICVEQSDNSNKLTTNIRISSYQPEIMEPPQGYENPFIMSGKEFQSIKNLHHSSDTMVVTSRGEYIRFSVSDDDRHDRRLEVGNENDEENQEYTPCSRSFKTSYITSLCKCAGQSGNIQVFLSEDLPLKIKLRAGNLGDISVYIKSKELISEENDDRLISDNENDYILPNDVSSHVSSSELEQLTLEDKERHPKRGRQKKNVN